MVAAAWGLGAIVTSVGAQVDVRAIAVTGWGVPGAGGDTYGALGTPTINAVGTMVFKAGLSGAGECIMAGASATLWPAARAGDAPPSIAASQFTTFDQPVISNTGAVAFSASINGGDATFESNRVVVCGPPGALSLMARTGTGAPGTFSGEVFYGFDTVRLGAGGHLALYATLNGEFVDGTNNAGVWSGATPATLVLAARSGDLVGAVIPGTLFTSVGIPSINAQGALALSGIIAGSGVSSTNDQVVFRGPPGALAVALREGAQAADAAAGVRYAALGVPGINAAGRIALAGSLRGTGVTAFSDTAAWTDAGGAWSQVVRAGDPATGVPNANISIPGSPRINAHGRLVLLSALTGAGINPSSDLALWSNVGGALTLVAQKGAPAPGVGGGVVISGFGPFALNAQGLVVYRATLSGPGVDASNNTALFVWDALGTRLVARTGTPIEVAGQARTPATIGVLLDSGLQDGRACSLSERGVLALQASFTDGGSAILTASLSRCPADIVEVGGTPTPDAQYTLDDILAFVDAWTFDDLIGDLAQLGGEPFPDGKLTLDDILLFVNAYNDGCPY